MVEEGGLPGRLRELINGGSTRGFAAAADVNEGTLRSVLKGTRPSIDFVIAICRAHHVSIAWLATGEGPKTAGLAGPLVAEYLSGALAIVEEWLDANNRSMTAAKKAEVVTQLYELIADDVAQGRNPVDVKRLHGILRLVA